MDAQVFNITRLFFGNLASWHFILETIVRISLLFACTLFAFHFFYRKDLVEFTSIELIVMLVLGTIIGDTAFYHSVPLIHALVALIVTVLVGRLIPYLGKRSERVEALVSGKAILVIKEGHVIEDHLALTVYSKRELFSLLRLQGVAHTGQVAYAFIETTGQLSIIKSEKQADKGVSTLEGLL